MSNVARKNLNNQSVVLEQLWVSVICPGCERQYSIRLKKPSFRHSCRCNKVTMYVVASNHQGTVHVTVNGVGNSGVPLDVEVVDIEIDD